VVTHDEKKHENDDDIDQAEFSFPHGKFSMRGASNGNLSLCIGVSTIIVAAGWTIANIIDSIWGK